MIKVHISLKTTTTNQKFQHTLHYFSISSASTHKNRGRGNLSHPSPGIYKSKNTPAKLSVSIFSHHIPQSRNWNYLRLKKTTKDWRFYFKFNNKSKLRLLFHKFDEWAPGYCGNPDFISVN